MGAENERAKRAERNPGLGFGIAWLRGEPTKSILRPGRAVRPDRVERQYSKVSCKPLERFILWNSVDMCEVLMKIRLVVRGRSEFDAALLENGAEFLPGFRRHGVGGTGVLVGLA